MSGCILFRIGLVLGPSSRCDAIATWLLYTIISVSVLWLLLWLILLLLALCVVIGCCEYYPISFLPVPIPLPSSCTYLLNLCNPSSGLYVHKGLVETRQGDWGGVVRRRKDRREVLLSCSLTPTFRCGFLPLPLLPLFSCFSVSFLMFISMHKSYKRKKNRKKINQMNDDDNIELQIQVVQS